MKGKGTRVDWQRIRSSPSALALIAANAVPLVGVIGFGWDLGALMLLYWLESAVVGFYNIMKMAVIWKWKALPVILFFIVHYGTFMTVHLLFILVLFVGAGPGEYDPFPHAERLTGLIQPTLIGALSLLASHGVSFYVNFIGAREYERTTLPQQMEAPYLRIVIMHLTIVFGGFVTMVIGAPVAALVLLVVLKTATDLWAHLKERSRLGPLSPATIASP